MAEPDYEREPSRDRPPGKSLRFDLIYVLSRIELRPYTSRSMIEQASPDRMTSREQAHLSVLKVIAAEPGISQRELAQRLCVSLGKTNYLLKALLEKGHLKAGNFRRSDNKLGYLYLLTPEGVKAKVALTRAYLMRKEAEYMALKGEIDAMRAELARLESVSSRELSTNARG